RLLGRRSLIGRRRGRSFRGHCLGRDILSRRFSGRFRRRGFRGRWGLSAGGGWTEQALEGRAGFFRFRRRGFTERAFLGRELGLLSRHAAADVGVFDFTGGRLGLGFLFQFLGHLFGEEDELVGLFLRSAADFRQFRGIDASQVVVRKEALLD